MSARSRREDKQGTEQGVVVVSLKICLVNMYFDR